MYRWVLKSLAVLPMLFLCACASSLGSGTATKAVGQNQLLFERIGGLPVLTKIVDALTEKIVESPRTKRSFEDIKLKPFKESVIAQLCNLTGGGCVYEGETMLNSHHDAKISEAEFDAFVDIFRDVLNQHLAEREKNELLKILAPMKRDIVSPI